MRLKLGVENQCPVVAAIVKRARSTDHVTDLATAQLREPRLLTDDDVSFEIKLERRIRPLQHLWLKPTISRFGPDDHAIRTEINRAEAVVTTDDHSIEQHVHAATQDRHLLRRDGVLRLEALHIERHRKTAR